MELTISFLDLLHTFRPVFTTPSFTTFVTVMTGWLLSHRHRFVTECILAGKAVGKGHYSNYHRFFSHAAWDLDTLCRLLAQLLIATFARHGLIELALDDTLCRKRGLTIYGSGMHHDPLLSSRAVKVVSWGHDWVVVGLLVRGCFWAPRKVWCLPLLCRLYRNRQGLTKGQQKAASTGRSSPRPGGPAAPAAHRSRPELAREMLALLASWFPERQFLVSADSTYGGGSVLRHLPTNVDLLSRVAPKAALYAPAPPVAPGRKPSGRPRRKGVRLPGMAAWAADRSQHWEVLTFDQFGLHATLWVKTIQALYYGAGKDRLLTIVLVHDPKGKRPDQMFYSTRLDGAARQLLATYANRWAIEVTFENCKQLLGLEDPANRVPKAVGRTAAMALVLYSVVVLWVQRVGHAWVVFPERPWYGHKAEASFADLLSALRRQSWVGRFAGVLGSDSPVEKELRWLIESASRAG